MKDHGTRKHSKFSASGAERWLACPGSVELSEGIPDKSSKWAEEGTTAHELLEVILLDRINKTRNASVSRIYTREMMSYGTHAADFIYDLHRKIQGSEILVETRIPLPFIHEEMFGTFDGAVLEHFGTLHVFDYKYGQGHAVGPVKNLQMIFYALGLAYRYHWNFTRAKVWIIQPRIKGYRRPESWTIEMEKLRGIYIPKFRKGVKRALSKDPAFVEGSWCHWCKAKGRCPLKVKAREQAAMNAFQPIPQLAETQLFTDDSDF